MSQDTEYTYEELIDSLRERVMEALREALRESQSPRTGKSIMQTVSDAIRDWFAENAPNVDDRTRWIDNPEIVPEPGFYRMEFETRNLSVDEEAKRMFPFSVNLYRVGYSVDIEIPNEAAT